MPGYQSCIAPAPVHGFERAEALPYETTTGATAHWTSWFTPGRFAALLGVLLAANFAAVLSGTQTFFLRDFSYFSYPIAQYHRECFWRGELPLWNPYNSLGLPFLAQWNTLTLYPGSLIYLLLPLPWSLNLFCVLHLFLGGLGMYFLAHRWTNNRFAASAAGMLFVWNGFMLNCLMWPNNIAALGLMPWVLWLTQRAWQQGGRMLVLAALVGGAQMLSGAPEVIFFTWVIAACVWFTDVLTQRAAVAPAIGRMTVVTLMVAGLAAAQLLPFFDLLRDSARTQSSEESYWPIPLWGWANFFVPLFRSARIVNGCYFQPDQEWVASYYTGVCGVALAITALLLVRRAYVWLFAALAALSIALAFGDNGCLYPALRKAAPQLAFMRFPVKFLIILNFVLPLLAAFALAHLVLATNRREMKRFAIICAAVSLITAGIVVFAKFNPGRYETWSVTFWSGLSRVGILAAFAAAVWFAARVHRTRTLALVSASALLLICADGITQSPKANPVIPSVALDRGLVRLEPAPTLAGNRAMMTRSAHDAVYAKMIADPWQDVLLHRQVLFANANLIDGHAVADGFYSLYLHDQRALWMKLWANQTNAIASPLLDFLSVAYVNVPGSIFDWTNRTSALPLATVGQAPVFADVSKTLAALVSPEFAPAREVYLPVEAKEMVRATTPVEARVLASKFTAHRVEAKVEAAADTVFVVAQTHYRNWRAFVNGKPAPIVRANHAFQAVPVPAGVHEVVLEYRDRSWQLGGLISLCAVALAIGLWFWLRPGAPMRGSPA